MPAIFRSHSVLAVAALAGSAFLAPAATGQQVDPKAAPKLPEIDGKSIIDTVKSALPTRVIGKEEVLILRLRGPFEFGSIDGSCISPYAVQLMLAICKERKPTAVVLDINSPGGLYVAMEEIVGEILAAQEEHKLRVAAWPSDAHSAAAIACLACREIYVRPLSRMGAATKVLGENAAPSPETAMDHKRESSRQARRRQIVEVTGRDIRILDAMEYPEKELWYRADVGFSETAQSGEGWIKIDDSADAPATLSAREMCQTGIAKGMASSEAELRDSLGLGTGASICVLDLADSKVRSALKPTTDAIQRWIDWREKSVADYRKLVEAKVRKFDEAISQVKALSTGDGWSQKDQEKLERAVKNCALLPKLDTSLEAAMQISDAGWLDCRKVKFDLAKNRADLAVSAIKPQSSGSGRRVDLSLVHERLVEAHNALIDFLNGCPDE